MKKLVMTALAGTILGVSALAAQAQAPAAPAAPGGAGGGAPAAAAAPAPLVNTGPVDPANWQFGPQFNVQGEVEIWNPVKRKMMAGEDVIGGTIRGTDPRIYCAMANAGYDFTWTEMQHEHISWEQVARMWRTCPDATAVPGVRVAYTDEREIQHAADGGALVIVVPTIDSAEEAKIAADWTFFPPMGRRSSGGGQGPGEMWNDVPGGYRATWNDNVVLILMIETLDGVKEVREIAKTPGISAIFAASGDLGNFSGYAQNSPDYQKLVSEIHAAAMEAGVRLCGPLSWRNPDPIRIGGADDFTCFQGGTEAAAIRRGVQAEITPAP